MKTRNEAKKKKMAGTKVLKSTNRGPENENRDGIRSRRKITSVIAFVYWLLQLSDT